MTIHAATPARPATRGRLTGTIAAACFWAYLVALTVATHVPRIDPAYFATVGRWSPLHPDKTMHLIAYGILGGLAGAAFARGLTAAAIIRLFVALACWGFIDEFTQPFFGRVAELLDWGHDIVGLVIGLSCAVALHRWRDSAGQAQGAGPESGRRSS